MVIRTRFHFCFRLHWISWEELEVPLTSLIWVSPKALLKYFHQPNSLWIPVANQAPHAIYLFVLSRVHHFYFSVSVDSCSGSPRSSSVVLPLLSGAGFSVYLLTSNTESCDEDSEVSESVLEEELADEPGTTTGTQLEKLQSMLLPLLGEMWFLTTGPMVGIPIIFTELPEWIVGVSSRSKTNSNKYSSLTFIVASPLVFPRLQFVWIKVSLADHMHTRSWIHCRIFHPAPLLTQPGIPFIPRASRM